MIVEALALVTCVLSGNLLVTILKARTLRKRVDVAEKRVVAGGESVETVGLLGPPPPSSIDEVLGALKNVSSYEREALFKSMIHLWRGATLSDMQAVFDLLSGYERASAIEFFLRNQVR